MPRQSIGRGQRQSVQEEGTQQSATKKTREQRLVNQGQIASVIGQPQQPSLRYNLRKRSGPQVSQLTFDATQQSAVDHWLHHSPESSRRQPSPENVSQRHGNRVLDLIASIQRYGYETVSTSEDSSGTSTIMDTTSSATGMTSSVPSSSVLLTEETVTVRDRTRSKTPKTIDARNSLFYTGLTKRNVDFDRTDDGGRAWIDKTLNLNRISVKSTKREEENWNSDLDECKDSDEAMFQRTAMMELLDRHSLNDCLNYICETSWTCLRMPRKPTEIPELTLPKPDLAVAFRSRTLISERSLRRLEELNLKAFVCPEANKEEKDLRAFHFFAMEAKGVEVRKGNTIANRQNFNTASQALHNMYQVMRVVGKEALFFEKVRVFTAVATAEFFVVRVHRAEKLTEITDFINPDYPLEFKFDEIVRVTENEYTRSRVLSITRSILLSYGVKVLLPILKEALNDILHNSTAATEFSRKRPAEAVLESFDSSRARLNDLDMSATSPQIG